MMKLRYRNFAIICTGIIYTWGFWLLTLVLPIASPPITALTITLILLAEALVVVIARALWEVPEKKVLHKK